MRNAPQSILVVDDDAVVRRVVAATLQRHGFAVVEAECGDDGLRSFSEHRGSLALILTDVLMPGMTGPEMIERILAIDPHARVMFMTGAISDTRLPRRETKRYQLIHKPFTPQHLLNTVI